MTTMTKSRPASLIPLFLPLLVVFQSSVAADSSGVSCGSTQFDFVGERCVNTTHYVNFDGNCTDGVLLEDVELISCFAKTDGKGPYCHDCSDSVKNMVCSNTEDSAEACSDQCEQTTYGYDFVDYCINETFWFTSEPICDYGYIEQLRAVGGSCATQTPDKPTCLDCGTVGICSEVSATCKSLGFSNGGSDANGGGDSGDGGSLFATSAGQSVGPKGIIGAIVLFALFLCSPF